MDPNTRPNVVTVGVLAGAVAQLFVYIWNSALPWQLGPNESGSVTIIFMAAAQAIDRRSKRRSEHVITKYGQGDANP